MQTPVAQHVIADDHVAQNIIGARIARITLDSHREISVPVRLDAFSRQHARQRRIWRRDRLPLYEGCILDPEEAGLRKTRVQRAIIS